MRTQRSAGMSVKLFWWAILSKSCERKYPRPTITRADLAKGFKTTLPRGQHLELNFNGKYEEKTASHPSVLSLLHRLSHRLARSLLMDEVALTLSQSKALCSQEPSTDYRRKSNVSWGNFSRETHFLSRSADRGGNLMLVKPRGNLIYDQHEINYWATLQQSTPGRIWVQKPLRKLNHVQSRNAK